MSSGTSAAFPAITPLSAHPSRSSSLALTPSRALAECSADITSTQREPALRNPQFDQARTWPLQTFLKLGALPSAVPCARLHIRQILWEWNLEPLTYSTELIVSELVTNAIHASHSLTASRYNGRWTPGRPPVRMWLQSNGEQVLIQIWDASDCTPKPRAEELEAENGRGLLLVTHLTTDWGTYVPERSSGKIVWAVVARMPQ
jgi:anti-sigma regulatory factor (Ser/Thr protein kinase)